MESTITTNEDTSRKSKKKIKNEYYCLSPHVTKTDHMRLIEPYEFKYQLYAKGRWVGKKLIDVLENEFRNLGHDYLLLAINEGRIMINNAIVHPYYPLKRNDFITHLTIRKENPIIDQPLEIIHDDKDFLVVNKPSSWPVHVCGRYQFNTLQRILIDEYNYKDLKVLHRLDKHTSGCVLFAKNKNAAERFRQKLHSDSIQKIYFARVRGSFAPQETIVKRSIKFVSKSRGVYTDVSDEEVEEYNKAREKKKLTLDGCKVKDEGGEEDEELNDPKYAETAFEKVFYDEKSNSSVVICKPKTGRTHQIRIHLRYLGFPIANDPCYGGVIYNDLKEFDNPDMKKYQFSTDDSGGEEEGEGEGDKGKEEEVKKISVSQIFCYKIWLHSWAYKFESYSFETSIPNWAKKEHIIACQF